ALPRRRRVEPGRRGAARTRRPHRRPVRGRGRPRTPPRRPPVVNTEDQVTLIESAVRGELGENAVQLTPQSMGGEDFAWYLTHCPGASSAWAPAPPAASPTTSTRAICSSTNAPWRSPPASSPPQRSRSSNAIVDDHGHRGPVPVVCKP